MTEESALDAFRRRQERERRIALQEKEEARKLKELERVSIPREARERTESRLRAFQVGMGASNFFKPVLGTALVAILLLGPGLAAVLTLFKAINIYWWIAFIVISVIIWRNR